MRLIDKSALEGKTLYFIDAKYGICEITEGAIAYFFNKELNMNLYKECYLTEDEAEQAEQALKEGVLTKVIRCEDCAVPHNEWTGCPKLGGLVTPPDFYCAFGKAVEE